MKENLSENEKKLENYNETLATEKKSFKRVKEEKLYGDAEINKLRTVKADLEKGLSESTSKISDLENKVSEATKKVENFEKDTNEVTSKMVKEKEVLKNDLTQKENEIESLKKELKTTLSNKNAEIENLKEDRESRANEINDLSMKVKSLEESLEETLAEAKGGPQLIEKIKDIMIRKGFLSDREFDELLLKLE